MSELGRAIRELRESKRLSQSELGERLEVTASSVSRWETGLSVPSPAARKKIARFFELSIDQFESMWRASRIDRTQGEPGRIPVINRAPAGIAIDYEEYGVDSGQGFTYIDSFGIDDPLAFAVEVVGDSMEPAIFEHDLLVFTPLTVPRPRRQLKEGDIVFVRFGPDSKHEGCTIARFSRGKDGKLLLGKDNRKHKAILVDREEIQQMSVMIQRRTERA